MKKLRFSSIFNVAVPLISIMVIIFTIFHTDKIVKESQINNSYDVIKGASLCLYMNATPEEQINDCVQQMITYYNGVKNKHIAIFDDELDVVFPVNVERGKSEHLNKLPEELLLAIRSNDEGSYYQNFGKYTIDASFLWVTHPYTHRRFAIVYMIADPTLGFSLLYMLYYINIAVCLLAIFKFQVIDKILYTNRIMSEKNKLTDQIISRTYDDINKFY